MELYGLHVVEVSGKIFRNVMVLGKPFTAVFVMISEGQRNDINFALPLLEHIPLEENSVLADR